MQNTLDTLNQTLNDKSNAIEAWFKAEWEKTPPPIYSSVDLRNAGFKLAPIDTNLFPAGFNNLNSNKLDQAVQAAKEAIHCICPEVKRLLIIPENHSRNVFYFESLSVLYEILNRAGFETRVGSLDENITEAVSPELPSGRHLTIEPLIREGNKVGVNDFFSCCIVLNNDLSAGIPTLLENVNQRIMPSAKLGWFSRLKSRHFRFYEVVAQAFAKQFDFDSWLINPFFDQCPEVDFMHKEGQECLIKRAQGVIKQTQLKYDEYGIMEKPFLAVKADAGTYGMAVMMIQSPQELGELNRKQRTRMSVSKGGKQVTKAFIQEGIPTQEKTPEGKTAESVVYMIGHQVVGGFYRAHDKREHNDNLNASGMTFQPLEPRYADTVVARLAALAAARELAELEK